jgi:hypothetical protein
MPSFTLVEDALNLVEEIVGVPGAHAVSPPVSRPVAPARQESRRRLDFASARGEMIR